MTDEVQQAAERLRRIRAGHAYGSQPRFNDLETLTDAYLATVAADEDEPIDEAWLLSVGFKHERGELVLDRMVVLDWMPGCLPTLFLGTEEITDWPKRSTVRQLASLLNIDLPPIAPKSRSVLRREAAMRGEEPPEFSKPSGQEEARPVNGLYKLLLERSQEIKNSGQEEGK